MRSHKYVIRHTQIATVFAAVAIGVGAPSAAWTQQASQASASAQLDARWQPWIGCWRPAAPPSADGVSYSTTPRSSDAPLVCVIPASNERASSSVNVLTVKDGKIVSRDTITVTGANVARSKDGCNGTESAKWSADGHRLYVGSEFTCPGGLKRTSSGLFAISPQGQWVNVQSVTASGSNAVRTLRYSDAGMPGTVPSEITDAIANQSLAVSTARAAAGERLSTAAVIDASRNADSSAVAAWLIDRGQGFNVDARELVALSDAGLPGNVTDAMVALSYPKAFALNHPDNVEGVAAGEDVAGAELERAKAPNVQVIMAPAYAPFSYAPFGFSPYDYYGYSPYGYSPYGYSPYGYSPYGYSPYGAYYSPYNGFAAGYGGWYYPPVIILKGGQSSTPQQRGYAVKGRGYTRTAPGNGSSTAQPRPTISSPSSGRADSPPPPPPPASQPASSGRTAHQRP
jgi:hypothetical protein